MRRLWLRLGLPIAAVLLIVASIVAITGYAYTSNRRDALALSRDVLLALDQRVMTQVQSYLTPAVRVLNLSRWMLPDGAFDGPDRSLAGRLSMEVLRNVPQLASVYFADPSGNFLMTRRAANGAIDTKTIEQRGAARKVEWVRRDPEGRTIAVEDDPADSYDPRTRPWFQAALTGAGVHWTDVYVFFTDRKPGITASVRIDGADGRPIGVVGVDIRLDALSEFLAGLKIGHTGRAMIIDADGRLVAFPEPERMMRQEGEALVPARLDGIGDPLLTRAFDRLRVLGPGQHVMRVDDARWVLAETPLRDVVGRDWSLVFVVPEDDFVGFVAANNRTTLLLSLAVVALAVALAALLAVQGFRADRDARRLRRRQSALERQAHALAALAASPALFDPGRPEGAAELTQVVAATMRARRASLWWAEAGGGRLSCEDCWDEETKGHTAGTELVVRDCPTLFAALLAGEEIAVADAAADPRTADLHRIYLQPVDCRALLTVPIRHYGRIAGALWVEDGETAAEPDVDAFTFVRAAAGMLGARAAARATGEEDAPAGIEPLASIEPSSLAASVGGVAAAGGRRRAATARGATPAAMRTSAVAGERSARFTARLAARGVAADATVSAMFPETTVLVLRLLDPESIARASPETGEPAIDRIVRALERITARHEIDYLKILSDQIVVVGGFSDDPVGQAEAIVETALAIRDHCLGDAGGADDGFAFAMGIDTGTVVGSAVGFGAFAYNVWGDAVRVASAMAASSPSGAIQVTESTRRLIGDRYLFRSRGAFWVDRVGELATYLLKGRVA